MSKEVKMKTARFFNKMVIITSTILCLVLVPLLIINSMLIFKSMINPDKFPMFFNNAPVSIMTDSMINTQTEDVSLEPGDMIIVSEITEKNVNKIRVGDIIAYSIDDENDVKRVVEIKMNSEGVISFITKADNVNHPELTMVNQKYVVGLYKMKFSGLGGISSFLQKPLGALLFIFLPLIMLLMYDIIRRKIFSGTEFISNDETVKELEHNRAVERAFENGNTTPKSRGGRII